MRISGQVPYLRVSDMEDSLRFYRDGLGFSVVRSLEEEGAVFWARLEKDGCALMISNRPSRFVEDPRDAHTHEAHAGHAHPFHGTEVVHAGALNLVFYVYVEDVDAAHDELKSRSVPVIEPPSDKFYGLREFLIRDPDGYYFAVGAALSQG